MGDRYPNSFAMQVPTYDRLSISPVRNGIQTVLNLRTDHLPLSATLVSWAENFES